MSYWIQTSLKKRLIKQTLFSHYLYVYWLNFYLNYNEQKMTAFAYLVFPNTTLSVLPEVEGEPVEHGIITSVTHGVMSGICYKLLLN